MVLHPFHISFLVLVLVAVLARSFSCHCAFVSTFLSMGPSIILLHTNTTLFRVHRRFALHCIASKDHERPLTFEATCMSFYVRCGSSKKVKNVNKLQSLHPRAKFSTRSIKISYSHFPHHPFNHHHHHHHHHHYIYKC